MKKHSLICIHQHRAIITHTFGTYVHPVADGVIVELYFCLAARIGADVWSPVDCAAEVCHWRYDGVVLHLEGLWLVEALEVCAAKSLLAFGRLTDMRI